MLWLSQSTYDQDDVNDVVYVNEEDKYQALISKLKKLMPKSSILVGTASIESSKNFQRS